MAEDNICEDFKVPEPVVEINRSICDAKPNTCETEVKKESKPENHKANSKLSPRVNVPLPYNEPDWSGSPPHDYSFEVIKNGTSISVVEIKTPSFVFGRLDVCNVVLEHPSVSRYHAIVQYCKGDGSHLKGFYLYDLGSTHGTFLNKEKIKPKIYYKLKVGYVVKFGGSTRLHIFQGPEEQEVEIEKKEIVQSKADIDACDWGMGEDAEEEDDLSENPFVLATPNESLYLDDPKKTLKGWFEREGYELEYDVEEKAFKSFCCRVQLPIDNPTGDFVTVEATVSGKKRESVVACALEACRTLDRYGLLRQSKQESRQRKQKKWEEDDFYDSDEDTYLDRTGTIEKKREIRKKIEKKSEVDTFETLQTKLKVVTEEISEIEKKLSDSTAGNTTSMSCEAEEDSLEMYMSSLKDNSKAPSDKMEKSKLKFRFAELEKKRKNLEKLIEIARPTKLPPVAKFPGIIGKKLKSKLSLPVSKPQLVSKKTDIEMQEVEEDESDTERDIEAPMEIEENEEKSEQQKLSEKHQTLKLEPETRTKCENKKRKEKQSLSPKSSVLENKVGPVNERLIGPKIPEEIVTSQKSHAKRTKKDVDVYSANNSEYSTWVPPANQSGDGITHLNAKFGY